MSTIIVTELGIESALNTLAQQFTVGSESKYIYAVRPHLYKHGNPSGSLVMKLYESNGTTLRATSESIALSSIGSTTFFHGKIRFLINSGLVASTNYYLKLESSGYTYNASNFVGWCRDFDDRIYTANFTTNLGMSSPYFFEFWTKEDYIR